MPFTAPLLSEHRMIVADEHLFGRKHIFQFKLNAYDLLLVILPAPCGADAQVMLAVSKHQNCVCVQFKRLQCDGGVNSKIGNKFRPE